MHVNKYVLGLGCSFGFAMAAACIFQGERPNEEHCWNKSGDATCAELYDGKLPFCSHEQSPCMADGEFGCVEERPKTDECYSPCGDQQSILENNECELNADGAEAGESGGESTSSGSVDSESGSGSTGDVPCDGACDPLLCQGGVCVECTELADAACIETGMWCNGTTCEQCTSHFQCPGGAGCHLEEGICLPPDVVYGAADGSLDEALSTLGVQSGTIRIHGHATYERDSTFTLTGEQIVAVVGVDHDDEDRAVIERSDNTDGADYALALGSGHLYLWGLGFSGDSGVRVSGSGDLQVEKVAFDNTRSAVYLSGGEAELLSCMLISDSDPGSPTLGVTNAGSANLVFSTLLARKGDNALRCSDESTMTVRNSILGSFQADNGISIDSCEYSIDNSVVESIDDITVSNSKVVELEPGDFEEVGNGDLHLAPEFQAKFESIAQWSDDDPHDDFDGETRAQQGKTWPGADHPQ